MICAICKASSESEDNAGVVWMAIDYPGFIDHWSICPACALKVRTKLNGLRAAEALKRMREGA